jgi:hypothetical protein
LGSHSQSAFLGEFYRGWHKELTQPCTICWDRGLEACELLHGFEDVPAEAAFEWAFERTRKSALVDTSKVTHWPRQGAASLDDVDIRLIHLVRDPRGWFASRLRRNPALNREGALREWIAKNDEIHDFARNSKVPCKTVFYEDIASDPIGTFPGIFRFLGLSFEAEALQYWTKDHHGFAGNGATSMVLPRDPGEVKNVFFRTGDDAFYRRSRDTMFLDKRWKTELPDDAIASIMGNEEIAAHLARAGKRMTEDGIVDVRVSPMRRIIERYLPRFAGASGALRKRRRVSSF